MDCVMGASGQKFQAAATILRFAGEICEGGDWRQNTRRGRTSTPRLCLHIARSSILPTAAVFTPEFSLTVSATSHNHG